MSTIRTIENLGGSPVATGAAMLVVTTGGVEGIRDNARWLLDRPCNYLPIDRHALILDKVHRIGTHIGSLEIRENLWVGPIIEMTEDKVVLVLEQQLFNKE